MYNSHRSLCNPCVRFFFRRCSTQPLAAWVLAPNTAGGRSKESACQPSESGARIKGSSAAPGTIPPVPRQPGFADLPLPTNNHLHPKVANRENWGRIPLRGPASQPLTPRETSGSPWFRRSSSAGPSRDRGSAPSASCGPPDPSPTPDELKQANLRQHRAGQKTRNRGGCRGCHYSEKRRK